MSAATARAWMMRLSKRGIGRHSVSAASSISDFLLYQIITGDRIKIRARTERKILAVDESCRGDNAHVSAAPTWKLIDELVERGYTKGWIAQRLGRKTRALQLNRKQITVRNAGAVERLYKLIEAGRISR